MFKFDKAAWIKVAKGGGFAAAGAFLTYVVAHVGDLDLGQSAPLVTALLGWAVQAITVWVTPITPEPTVIRFDPDTDKPVAK